MNLSKNEILMLLKQNGVFDALSNDPTALIISFDDDKKTLLSVKKAGRFLIVKEQNKIPFKIFIWKHIFD